MESVNTFFKKERDTLYQWGGQEGLAKAEKEKKDMARQCWLNRNL
jgi:hypothetical protein